jgi:hypothetical protein
LIFVGQRVPEEVINALHSFDCDSDEDFVGFE